MHQILTLCANMPRSNSLLNSMCDPPFTYFSFEKGVYTALITFIHSDMLCCLAVSAIFEGKLFAPLTKLASVFKLVRIKRVTLPVAFLNCTCQLVYQ